MSVNRPKTRTPSRSVAQKSQRENSIRKLSNKGPKEVLKSQSANVLMSQRPKEVKSATGEVVSRALKTEAVGVKPSETISPARCKVAKLISDLEEFNSKANAVVENFSAMSSQIDSLHEELRHLNSPS